MTLKMSCAGSLPSTRTSTLWSTGEHQRWTGPVGAWQRAGGAPTGAVRTTTQDCLKRWAEAVVTSLQGRNRTVCHRTRHERHADLVLFLKRLSCVADLPISPSEATYLPWPLEIYSEIWMPCFYPKANTIIYDTLYDTGNYSYRPAFYLHANW